MPLDKYFAICYTGAWQGGNQKSLLPVPENISRISFCSNGLVGFK